MTSIIQQCERIGGLLCALETEAQRIDNDAALIPKQAADSGPFARRGVATSEPPLDLDVLNAREVCQRALGDCGYLLRDAIATCQRAR